MQYKSSYSNQFGEPPKAAEDFMALKKTKFGQQDISMYIQPLGKQFIEKWLSLNSDNDFIKKIYFTTREIYTIIRN